MFDFSVLPDVSGFVYALFGIDDVVVGLVASAVISAAVSAGTTYYNSKQQQAANDANIDLANQSMAANKEVAQHGLSWKVQDAQNAGLSPLAALGASTHGNIVNASTPQVQAPQANTDSLMQSLTALSNEFAHDTTLENIEGSQARTARAGFASQRQIARMNNETTERVADARLKFEYEQADAELAEKIRQYDNSTALDIRKYNEDNKLKWRMLDTEITENTAKRLEKVSDNEMQVLSNFCRETGIYIPMEDFKIDSMAKYQEWLQLDSDFSDNFSSANKSLNDMFKGMSAEERYAFIQRSQGKSKGWNLGVNANGSLGSQSSTTDTTTESVGNKLPGAQGMLDVLQGKKFSQGSLSDRFLKGIGASGGYNSSESSTDSFQRDKLESYTRASEYFKGMKYYRPVFTESFLKEFAGSGTYADLYDSGSKSSYKGLRYKSFRGR